jgi:hypothetical protein
MDHAKTPTGTGAGAAQRLPPESGCVVEMHNLEVGHKYPLEYSGPANPTWVPKDVPFTAIAATIVLTTGS